MIETITRTDDSIVQIQARARRSTGICPGCGQRSSRLHSRYRRSLADAPVGGQPVRIVLSVRRFFCPNTGCERRTFAEQIDGLTRRHGRRSVPLRQTLTTIGLFLAGRAGARLARQLAVPVSRMTLLRLVRSLPDRVPGETTAIGVDDFALCRGHVYGTILIDMHTHQPVDVLPDRTADTLTEWLQQRTGVQTVCRDRAGAYAEGGRAGAPDATQVADRWHLWHNLTEAVEKTVTSHRAELAPPPETDHSDQIEGVALASVPQPAAQDEGQQVEARLVTRTRERFAAVQQYRRRGDSITAIGRELELDRRTVRRFANAESLEELLTTTRARESLLDAYKPYLHQRFNSGHTDAAALTSEIKELGYRGSAKTVRRYLQPFRATLTAPPPLPMPPSVRQVTGWLTRHPDSLNEDERLDLKQVLNRSQPLATTHQQVHEFADILTNRRGHRIQEWMRQVQTSGCAALRSFASGLANDLDAVIAGLTLEYSSGAVEGNVNRIKTIKRQMYGRASFDLLRKRILNPA